MAKSRLQHIRDERLEKLNKLREMGINPFPAESRKDHDNQEIVDNYDKFEGKEISLTGRLMSLRDHGHLMFADLADQSGSIQLYIHDEVLELFSQENQTLGIDELKNYLDTGDFVEASGIVTKTKTGQISLQPKTVKILTKTLRPLPNPHDMVADPEIKFRRRYIDLATNRETQARFMRKAKFWQVQREFLYKRGFIEVEVPVLEHVTGGADARPFTTHMNALDQDFYMRISTELYQKRLIGGGYEKVFTLGPNFRNEGLSDEHLPEYSQLEWYWAYADYKQGMEFIRDMYRDVAKKVYGTSKFTKNEHTFDLANEWELISYPKAIQDRFNIDIFKDSNEDMLKILKEHKIKLDGAINRSRLVDNLWKLIRKDLAGPAFLVDTPKFVSPLSKSMPGNADITQRFQAVIAGSELGNGYSELNDPLDQLGRFREQQNARESGDDEAQMLDIDFVEMLEFGMPPTTGWGHSERLFWALENITAREGTLFPALRHKTEPLTKQIYGIK